MEYKFLISCRGRGITNYTATLSSNGDEKTFNSTNINELITLVINQYRKWNNWYYNPSLNENKELVKLIVRQTNEGLEKTITTLKTILADGLKQDINAILARKKDFSPFQEPLLQSNQLNVFPETPPQTFQMKVIQDEPKMSDHKYFPLSEYVDKSIFKEMNSLHQETIIFPKEPLKKVFQFASTFRKKHKAWEEFCDDLRALIKQYEQDHKDWSSMKSASIEEYEKKYKEWEKRKQSFIDNLTKEDAENYLAWEKRKKSFLDLQNENNKKIDDLISSISMSIEKNVPGVVLDILMFSEYPLKWDKNIQFVFNEETGILVLDYRLPAPDDVEFVKEFKVNNAKERIEEVSFAENQKNKIYDDIIYQITLRSIYEVYHYDVMKKIEGIVFNGYVETIDKGTGKDCRGCVLSIQTSRKEFEEINLSNVDPKTCFKTLKGIGSSKLYSITPIAPIAKINTEDKRFVASYEVVKDLDERSNLAAMDWEDFEHLIRELFEKEFSQHGGEVKVTQASRDGGVDAIAFDPDPIRGGKIVIQAKRYTNTVGVSAVRDLYGTLMNEGATKGILVTTSDYGPDAYDFAKGKPITLLNGGNLLHLLEKHGHKAKIDIKEARSILAEKESKTKNFG